MVHLEKGRLKGVVSIDQTKGSGYLTLVMAELVVTTEQINSALMKIEGVQNVNFSAPNRFLIEYDSVNYPLIDQQVMKHVSANGWAYRQLVNGRTLEDQLYFG